MNNHKKYYAARLWSGEKTTTGAPNCITGRSSIAHTLVAFASIKDRNAWVAKGSGTSNCRKAVSKHQARQLNLGLTVAEFDYLLSILEVIQYV